MPTESDNWPLAVSRKIYGRLLLAYPKSHRAEYGPAMEQLFHDQCRDAWNKSRGWGMAKLWLRVLVDLVKTSIIERLSALTKKKSMSDKMTALIQPRIIFLKVFAVVFLMIFCCSVAVTFWLPVAYASTSEIIAKPDTDQSANSSIYDPYFIQTTCEIIKSQIVLEPVIDKLNLNDKWGKKYGMGAFKTSETLPQLQSMISLSPVRNTALLDITVYSGDKIEAAQIANAIAESYQNYRIKIPAKLTADGIKKLQEEYEKVAITKTAEPGREPVRPNKPLTIAWGIVTGILFGLAIGGGIAGIVALIRRKPSGGGTISRTDASFRPATPDSADDIHTKVSMASIMGFLWMAISGFLASLGAFVLFQNFGNVSKSSDLLFLLLFEIISVGNVAAGFFLFRGKLRARICIGTEAILLTTYFLFIGVPLVPHLFRWMPIVFMVITACGLFWPRKQTCVNRCQKIPTI